MAFVTDSFTDVDNTVLESHVGETGATWTEHADFAAGTHLITVNRLRCSTANTQHYASGTPVNANYYVEGVYFVHTLTGISPSICARLATATSSMYFIRHSITNTRWDLFKVVAGTATSLGTFTQVLDVSTSYTARLSVFGTSVRLLVDGVERIAVIDSDITAAGRPGVRSSTSQNVGAGVHLDSITAVDIEGGIRLLPLTGVGT